MSCTYTMMILLHGATTFTFSQATTTSTVSTQPSTTVVSWHFSITTDLNGDSKYKWAFWHRWTLTVLLHNTSPVLATVRRHTWLQMIRLQLKEKKIFINFTITLRFGFLRKRCDPQRSRVKSLWISSYKQDGPKQERPFKISVNFH